MSTAAVAVPPSSRSRRRAVAGLILISLMVFGDPVGATGAVPAATPPEGPELGQRGWVWPLPAFRLEEPFIAPAHPYGPGHRGIDLRSVERNPVRSPAAGTVAFAGSVAGRGILTIEHGDGLVTTLEPIDTELEPGTAVFAGDAVGVVAVGGHTAPGALHFGVRLHGEYINPMLLLGGVPRAVLLPCC